MHSFRNWLATWGKIVKNTDVCGARKIAFVAGAAVGMCGSTSFAATFSVPGSFATIQGAVNAASSGDVILVSPGTYTSSIDYLNKALAIRSVGGASVTTIKIPQGVSVTMGSNAEFTGFTLDGGNTDSVGGIAVTGTGQLIENNVFKNGRNLGGVAISGNNASPTIINNIFTQNSDENQANDLTGVVAFLNNSSPYIANNLFSNNTARAINLTVPISAAPVIINNTIVGNAVGIHVDNRVSAANETVRNNIISKNTIGLEDIFAAGGPGGLPWPGPAWQDNLLFGNTTQYSGIADQTGTSGNLASNPLFVSSTDFHLTIGSPAIGVGSSLLAPTNDLDGRFRPINSIDLGAYQFSIPEPTTLGVLGLGMAGLLLSRKGQNRKRNFLPAACLAKNDKKRRTAVRPVQEMA